MKLTRYETPLDNAHITPVMWALTGTALALSLGRYGIHWATNRKLMLDDLTHAIAQLALVGAAISIDYYVGVVLKQLQVESHGYWPLDPQIILARKWQTAFTICSWTSLWFVKFTFLLIYREIFKISSGFRKAWWCVTVFTAATYFVAIVGVITMCGLPKDLFDIPECAAHQDLYIDIIIYSGVLHVVTDLLIMGLPMWMIQKLHIPRSRKLALGLVFSIAFVTVALEILRSVRYVQVVQGGHGPADPQFGPGTLYSAIEVGLSACLSSLPAYMALFDRSSAVRGWVRRRLQKAEPSCPRCGHTESRQSSSYATQSHSKRSAFRHPREATATHVEHASDCKDFRVK